MSSVIVLLNYNGDGFYGLLKVYSCIPLGHWMLNLGNLFLCPGADESCRDARLQIPKVRPKAQPTLFVAKMNCRNDDATGRWVAKKVGGEIRFLISCILFAVCPKKSCVILHSVPLDPMDATHFPPPSSSFQRLVIL